MTKEELDAIRERVNEATYGPWELGRKHGKSGWSEALPVGSQVIVSNGTMWALGMDVCAVPYRDTADGWFIVHAREDVPRLLDEVGRLRETLKWYADKYNWSQRVDGSCVFDIDTPDESMWEFDEHPWDIACSALDGDA